MWEKKRGACRRGERRESVSVHEGCAHLDAFVIMTVRFLRVQVYEANLTGRYRWRWTLHEESRADVSCAPKLPSLRRRATGVTLDYSSLHLTEEPEEDSAVFKGSFIVSLVMGSVVYCVCMWDVHSLQSFLPSPGITIGLDVHAAICYTAPRGSRRKQAMIFFQSYFPVS